MEQKMIKVISAMPEKVQARFKVLHMLSDARSVLNDQFAKEVKEMSELFAKKKQPTLDRRDLIVQGEITDFASEVPKFEEQQPVLEEIVAGNKAKKEAKKDKFDDEDDEEPHVPTNVDHLKEQKGIPDFWSKAIQNNQIMMQNFREKDREIIPFVSNLKCTYSEDPKVVSFTLDFKENEFFNNTQLTSTVRFKKDDDDEVEAVEGCDIDWNEGKDVTKKKIKKK